MVPLLSLLTAHTNRHTAATSSRCSARHIATAGGNNRCSQLLPHSLQPPKAHQKTHKALPGPPSHPNTPSGQERRQHQGLSESISGRKIINKETDLSQKKRGEKGRVGCRYRQSNRAPS